MKRSRFLKALGLIAVAPAALAKSLDSEVVINPITEVPDNLIPGGGMVKSGIIIPEGTPYKWYYETELETHKRFDRSFLSLPSRPATDRNTVIIIEK